MAPHDKQAQRKLVRVELEYDNGEVTTLKGDEAAKWLEAVNGAVMNAWVHGVSLPEFPWEKSTRDPAKVP